MRQQRRVAGERTERIADNFRARGKKVWIKAGAKRGVYDSVYDFIAGTYYTIS